jgi:hypothetical protein
MCSKDSGVLSLTLLVLGEPSRLICENGANDDLCRAGIRIPVTPQRERTKIQGIVQTVRPGRGYLFLEKKTQVVCLLSVRATNLESQ